MQDQRRRPKRVGKSMVTDVQGVESNRCLVGSLTESVHSDMNDEESDG